jgi:hypothetical protein
MAGDELVRGVTVVVLAPTLGEHVFFPVLQHRKPPDLLKILGEAGFGRKDRGGRGAGRVQRPTAFETKVPVCGRLSR